MFVQHEFADCREHLPIEDLVNLRNSCRLHCGLRITPNRVLTRTLASHSLTRGCILGGGELLANHSLTRRWILGSEVWVG